MVQHCGSDCEDTAVAPVVISLFVGHASGEVAEKMSVEHFASKLALFDRPAVIWTRY